MPQPEQSGIWISGPRASRFGGMRAQSGKIRLLIVDDHERFRQGLRMTFELEPDIEVVGEAADGQKAIDLAARLNPDIVLMDVNMPGMNGMETTRKLADAYVGIRVITLTMYKDPAHLLEARRAGAIAYVMKDATEGVLLQTIRNVMEGDAPLLQDGTNYSTYAAQETNRLSRPTSSATDYLITSNERMILRLLAEERTNEQIAAQLGVPLAMVRTYLEEIYRKLGVDGREAAILYAQRNMLRRPDERPPASI